MASSTTSILPTPSSLTQPQPPQSANLEHLSQEEQDKLKASVFQRLHPRLYLERYLDEEVRPDGREFAGWRGVFVNVGSISTAEGSALVRMGNTSVVCGVKAEIAEPELDRENEGYLVPNLDLPAMCSPKFKPGPPAEEAQVLSERLNQALLTSNILSLSSLCIEPGKAVWVLYVDAVCINYDGNAFDATLLAMVAALRNTKLPQARYDPETRQTLCSRTAPHLPLQLSGTIPIGLSFGIFDSKYILADPTAFEEPLLDSTISIVLGDEGEIISVEQLGSALIDDEEAQGEKRDVLKECIDAARARREVLVKEVFDSSDK